MLILKQVHGDWRVFVNDEDHGPAPMIAVDVWQQLEQERAMRRRAEIERDGWREQYEQATRDKEG